MIQLKPHQIEAIESKKDFLFMSAGSGKTIVALSIAKKLKDMGLIHNILVTTTRSQVDASVIGNQEWFSDYEKVFDIKPRIAEINNKNMLGFFNMDLAMVTHSEKALEKLLKFRLDLSKTCVIFDEIHELKNPGEFEGNKLVAGKAGYFSVQISKRAYKTIGLTATPSSIGFIDYANYLIMANVIPDLKYFKETFCKLEMVEKNGKKKMEVVGYKNEKQLQALIEKIAFRTKDTEELSGIKIKEHYINFMYDSSEVEKFMSTWKYTPYGEKQVHATTYSKRKHCMSMVVNGMQKKVNAKSKYVYDLIVEKKVGKTVVFYNFKEDYVNLKRTIEHYNEVYNTNVKFKTINGKVKELDYNEDDVDLIFVQFKAGGSSLNMQSFTNAVFYSLTNSYMMYEQALGRNNRLNQTNDLNVYYLINMYEQNILESLRRKEDYNYAKDKTFNVWKKEIKNGS